MAHSGELRSAVHLKRTFLPASSPFPPSSPTRVLHPRALLTSHALHTSSPAASCVVGNLPWNTCARQPTRHKLPSLPICAIRCSKAHKSHTTHAHKQQQHGSLAAFPDYPPCPDSTGSQPRPSLSLTLAPEPACRPSRPSSLLSRAAPKLTFWVNGSLRRSLCQV